MSSSSAMMRTSCPIVSARLSCSHEGLINSTFPRSYVMNTRCSPIASSSDSYPCQFTPVRTKCCSGIASIVIRNSFHHRQRHAPLTLFPLNLLPPAPQLPDRVRRKDVHLL